MRKRSDSKERMVQATADLLQRQGYAATGLNQIVSEAQAPKGSLYFHFPGGKEELAAAAMEHSATEMRAVFEDLLDGVDDLGESIDRIVAYLAEDLRASKFQNGCPVATVALEASHTSDRLRTVCENGYQSWTAAIAERIEAAGIDPAVAHRLALAGLAAIEGGLLMSRVYRTTEPLEAVADQLKMLLALGRSMG